MIKKIIAVVGVILTTINSVKAVPIGNDVEYIPPPRRLGIQVINPSASAKLHVNGSVLIDDGSQSDGFVLSTDASGLASWKDVNSLVTQVSLNGSTLNNPTLNGNVTFTNNSIVNSLNVNGSVFASLFNGTTIISQTFLGGNFFGNGNGLTNLNANNITGTINVNNIDPNFRPTALKAPDGDPNPALEVQNDGDIKFGLPARGSNIHQSYLALGETVSGASSVLANNARVVSTASNTLVKSVSTNDNANWLRLNYFHGITFHTGKDGAAGTQFPDSDNERLRIANDGNVGVNTHAPLAKLHVHGAGPNITRFGKVTGSSTFGHVFGLQNRGGIITVKEGGSTLVPEDRRHVIYSNNQGAYIGVYDNGGSQDIRVSALENDNTYFLSNNIGIGTKLPDEKLQVVGNVKADKFIGEVDAANITGTVNVNNIDPNFRPTALKAPGGGPNPAVHVGNEGIVTLLYHQDALPAEPGLIPSLVINNSSTNNNTAVGLRFNSNVFGGAAAGIVGRAENSDRMSLDFYTEGPTVGRTTKMSIDTAGNVGIGIDINDPAEKLEVAGNIKADQIFANNVTPAPAFSGVHGSSYAAVSVNPTIFLSETDTTDQNFDIQVNSGSLRILEVDDDRNQPNGFRERFLINPDGNVGINMHNPTEKLEVAGNVKAVRFIGDGSGLTGITTNNTSINDLTDASASPNSVHLGTGSGGPSTGSFNTALGINALNRSISSHNNTAVGFDSMKLVGGLTSRYNTAVGHESLRGSSNSAAGLYNTAIGSMALRSLTSAKSNTAIGQGTLYNLTTGENNIALGKSAGANITTGTGNIIIGTNNSAPNATASNQLDIGDVIYGNLAIGQKTVGIGTTNPTEKLEVAGKTKTQCIILGDNTEICSKQDIIDIINDAKQNTFNWVVGNFGICRWQEHGKQIRTVECQNGNGQVVADSNCADPKPSTEQNCEICDSYPPGQYLSGIPGHQKNQANYNPTTGLGDPLFQNYFWDVNGLPERGQGENYYNANHVGDAVCKAAFGSSKIRVRDMYGHAVHSGGDNHQWDLVNGTWTLFTSSSGGRTVFNKGLDCACP